MAAKKTNLHPRAQVASLVRSASIAMGKADRLRANGLRVEASEMAAKATAAADAICEIVSNHPEVDWDLPQRRAAELWRRGRKLGDWSKWDGEGFSRRRA